MKNKIPSSLMSFYAFFSLFSGHAMEIKEESTLTTQSFSSQSQPITINTNTMDYDSVIKLTESLRDSKAKSVTFNHDFCSNMEICDDDKLINIVRLVRDTDITILEFINYDMTALLAGKIIEELKGSKIHKLTLTGNRVGRHWIDDDLVRNRLLADDGLATDDEHAINTEDMNRIKTTSRGLEYLFPSLNESPIKFISLQKNCLTDRDAICLAQNLPFSNLTGVDLQKNSIENKGAIVIAEILKNSLHLTTLLLGENKIGNEGLIAIFQNLKESSIRILDLEGYYYHEHLYDEETIEIVSPLLHESPLQVLSLATRNIGNRSAQALAQNFPGSQLTRINLQHNKIGDEGAIAIAENLKNSLHLTTLLLGGNQIGRAGLSAIFANVKGSNIQTLDLGNHDSFTGQDVEETAPAFKGTKLQILCMGGCPYLGDDGVMALAKSFQGSLIRMIDLSGANVKDNARLFAENIKNTNIQTIYFSLNFCSDSTRVFLKNTYSSITWFFNISEQLPLKELIWQSN